MTAPYGRAPSMMVSATKVRAIRNTATVEVASRVQMTVKVTRGHRRIQVLGTRLRSDRLVPHCDGRDQVTKLNDFLSAVLMRTEVPC